MYSWFNVCPALQWELHNHHSYRQKVSLLPDLPVIWFFNSYILAVLPHNNPHPCVSSFLIWLCLTHPQTRVHFARRPPCWWPWAPHCRNKASRGGETQAYTHTIVPLLLLCALYKLFTLFISVLPSISNTSGLDGCQGLSSFVMLCLLVRHFQLAGMIG